jgi:alpha-D-ribose 1-methylphosphonate 5-triphosphate synthase subunit PhnH
MQSMSHPGRIYSIDMLKVNVSPIVLVGQTLLDHEVEFCIIQNDKNRLFNEQQASINGARVSEIEKADFIFIESEKSNGEIIKAKRGSLEYPDEGATAIYHIPFLKLSQSVNYMLSGPGIPDDWMYGIEGLDNNELMLLHEINLEYPLGIDAMFVTPDGSLVSIPRSVRIKRRT